MTIRAHTRHTTTAGTTGVALTAVALGAALSLSACGGAAPPPNHADQVALTALNNLTTDPAAATAAFTPAMVQIAPAATLDQDWKRYQQLLGNYQSHGQPQDLPQGAMTVVNLPLSMSHAPGQLRITVDHDGHIAGLFFLNADTPLPAHPAAPPIHPAASLTPAHPAASGGPVATPAQVVLSSPQVHIGQTYSVSASGFAPGENVTFSWTGPTHGVMGTTPAGPDGRAAMTTPIIEKDPAGTYSITATGTSPGHTATTPLHVLPTT